MRVDDLESYVSSLDLCNLFVKIEASETFAALFECFLTLRKQEVIQFGAKMKLRVKSCFLLLGWIQSNLEASQHEAEIAKIVRGLSPGRVKVSSEHPTFQRWDELRQCL